MNIDCQWINENLEALFSGTLAQEDQDRAQHHIESCGSCGKEIAALKSIDPLVKRYFEGELDRVRRGTPRNFAKGRLVALSSAALIAICLLLVAALRTSHPNPAIPNIGPAQAVASAQPPALPPVKSIDTATSEVERAKPVESAANDQAQTPPVLATSDNGAPEFLVTDPAGYSRTLNDYRGHVFVMGVLNSSQPESIANFERLYRAFNSNPKFRFLAVSNERQVKPTNTTFPVAYNQGSKLFGTLPGNFVLLDEMGSIRLRGSVVKDFDSLQKALQNR
jgi:hypothetical protein